MVLRQYAEEDEEDGWRDRPHPAGTAIWWLISTIVSRYVRSIRGGLYGIRQVCFLQPFTCSCPPPPRPGAHDLWRCASVFHHQNGEINTPLPYSQGEYKSTYPLDTSLCVAMS